MPFIIHHNDDDGRASAAIIYNECIRARYSKYQLIEWCHGKPIPYIDVMDTFPNDYVYIVDLALDDNIANLILSIVKQRDDIHIVHIDHHQTSVERIERLRRIERISRDQQSGMNVIPKNYQYLFRVGVSATLLCWTYASMTDDEREHLEDVEFDFTDTRSHLLINGHGDVENYREISIPMILRFIDDYDVWRRALDPNTEYFHNAFFCMEEKQDPTSELWSSLIYTNAYSVLDAILQRGEHITSYMIANNKYMMRNAFVCEFEGYRILCVNGYGNANVFGDQLEAYDACCVFHYDGKIKKWRYSFRSHENGIDVAHLCEKYGGGGHKLAAGMCTDELLFK